MGSHYSGTLGIPFISGKQEQYQSWLAGFSICQELDYSPFLSRLLELTAPKHCTPSGEVREGLADHAPKVVAGDTTPAGGPPTCRYAVVHGCPTPGEQERLTVVNQENTRGQGKARENGAKRRGRDMRRGKGGVGGLMTGTGCLGSLHFSCFDTCV